MTTLAALAANAFLTALWQGALLTAAVAMLLRIVPGISAAVRSALWGALFLLVVALHFIPAYAAPDTHHASPAWSWAVAGLWLACALLRGSQLVVGAFHLRTLARRATPVEPSHLVAAGPLRRAAVLCTSPEVDRPSVIGFFFPRILLPPRLYSTLSPQELEHVLLHEASHLHRGDDWTNLLQKLALVLFPLNPALHWVEHRLCQERELACDDRVLAATAAPKAYALCLTSLAEYAARHRTLALALGAWQRQSELAARIHRILTRSGSKLSHTQTAALTSAMLLLLATGAGTLARSPQLLSFAPVSGPQGQTFTAAMRAAVPASPEAVPAAAFPVATLKPARAVLAKAVLPAAETRLRRTSGTPRPTQGMEILRRRRLMHAVRAVPVASITPPANSRQRLTFTLTGTITRAYPDAPAFLPTAFAVRVPEGWIVIQL